MTPADWHRLRDLLDQALQHPASQRPAFLDAACADAPALRDELEALLAAHERAEATDAFASPFARAHRPAPLEEDTEEGERVGPYRLVRLLGRGGMGTVYLAERDDGQFRQTVALKLIRRGLDTDDLLSRFAFERQILAGLDHPHIARLYDGGVTEDGRPYFAMEHVEGVPLTDYCDARRLSTQQRLALFRTVCRAVQHAHQNLVVHRDLKPSNILVTEDGTVKLLDFGIAKLLEEEGLDEGPARPQTRTGVHLLTPEYAAPEQVRGAAITTATDVYQLGVLLYELLTGHRPYRLPSRVQYEIARVILEEEPERPSTAVGRTEARVEGTEHRTPETVSQARATDPGRLQRRLAGDLDVICLTALKKEPMRRYASVEALAEDVRRHLVGLPVAARPDTFGYRASRFVRRNRVGVIAASVVALAVLGGAGLALWQGRVAAAERDRAEAVNQFLIDLLAAPDPREEGRDVRVVSLLEQAAADLDSSFAQQPDVEATLRQTLGVTYRELGLYEEAETQLRRALDLREALYGPLHRDVLATQDALGNTFIYSGAYPRADSLLTLSLASARALYGEADKLTGTLLSNLAFVRYVSGDLDASLALHQASVSIEEQQPNPDEIEIAAGLGNVAIVLADLGKLDEAAPILERQVDIYREILEPDNSRIGRALTNLGSVYYDANRLDEAEKAYNEAIAVFRRTHGEAHHEVAWALGGLGSVLTAMARYDEAETTLRESLRLYEETLGAEHPRIGGALLRLGQALRLKGEADAAETHLRRALRLFRATLPAGHPTLGRGLAALGELAYEQGRVAEAESLLREALAVHEAALPPEHPDRLETASLLGQTLSALGRPAEAAPLLQDSYEALQSSLGPDDDRAKEAHARLRSFYEATGKAMQ